MKFTQIYLDNFVKTTLVVAVVIGIYIAAATTKLVVPVFGGLAATTVIAFILSIFQYRKYNKPVD